MEHTKEKQANRKTAVINLRPLLFCAIGLVFGLFLYGKIMFGGSSPVEFLLPVILILVVLFPFSRKRIAVVLLCVLLFAGAGMGLAHAYNRSYQKSVEAGKCTVAGTVVTVAQKEGYCLVILKDLNVDGEELGGKCRIYLSSEEIRPADILQVSANLTPVFTENFAGDGFIRYCYSQNIRYTASASEVQRIGRSKNPFLRLNASLQNTLYSSMDSEEASVAYALLTGNSAGMDEGVLLSVRRGGIAHIFAVSGLHIGILFAAICLVCRRLGKYKFLPAILVAACYCALCNFSVSSVRALIMCATLAAMRAVGRKYDFLDSISLAALIVLLFSPAQWYSVGFRLSFGACLGLALFAGPFSRLFKRIKLPNFLAQYLSANLSVQLLLLPIQLEAFGFVSVWGTLLNFIFIPLLPILFLGLMVLSALALIIPPAATVFLSLPEGALSVFLYFFAVVDPKLVLAGFSVGAGAAAIWLAGCVFLSERVRMRPSGRAILAAGLSCLLILSLLLNNVVFSGCRIDFLTSGEDKAVLIRTRTERVLIIDDEISFSKCQDLLNRNCKNLTHIVVLCEDELAALNTAAFLPAENIFAREEVETGFRKTNILFAQKFSCGEMKFTYVSSQKLVLSVEDLIVEIDFEGSPALGADLFVGEGRGGLKYFLKDGIINSQNSLQAKNFGEF